MFKNAEVIWEIRAGLIQFELFSQGELIFTSGIYSEFFSRFAGLVSDQPFDAARIVDPLVSTNIDDLLFGPAIPAPATWLPGLLLPLVALSRRRRVRRTRFSGAVSP